MKFKKSIQGTLAGIIVAAQLFSTLGTTVVYSSTDNNEELTTDEVIFETQPLDNRENPINRQMLDTQFHYSEQQLNALITEFAENNNQLEYDSNLLREVIFALNIMFRQTNEESSSEEDDAFLVFLDELESNLTFNLEQTITEQAIFIGDFLQIEELPEVVISLSEAYNLLKEVEVETETTPSSEIIQEDETEASDEEVLLEEPVEKVALFTNGIQSFDSIISQKPVEYMAKVIKGNTTLDTLPAGVEGAKTVFNSSNYLNRTYKIVEEAVTQKGTFVRFYLNGSYVWLDKAAIEPEAMTNTKNTSYPATITRGTDTINSLPWGIPEFTTISKSDVYLGSEVIVLKETTTPRANWAYVQLFNGTTLGWIDITAISKRGVEPILLSEKVNYQAKIIGSHSLDTAPWGTAGYKTVDSSNKHIGKTVYVLEEATTYRASWAKINLNGRILWIDIKGLESEQVSNHRTIKYDATITRGTDTINTLPWGVKGFESVGKTSSYLNKKITVIEEAATPRATWVKIQYNGQVLGWIDRAAIKLVPNYTAPVDSWISSTAVNYQAKIIGKHSLDTLPWGIAGFKTVGRSEDHIGKTVRIVEEAVTSRAKWVKFSLNGQLVWMDAKGIEPEAILYSEKVDYEADIIRTTDTINTLPWGVKGFKTVSNTAAYKGKTVRVLEIATTPRATWALVAMNGQTLGWMDIEGLKNKTKTIFIDVGHGGVDPGAVYFGVNEKDINLEVSLKLQKELEKRGYEVIMLRTNDKSYDYKTERSRIANASNADIFISVHHNANPWVPTAHGIETFYYEYDPNYPSKINQEFHNDPVRIAESARLAANIHNALIKETRSFNRGVKRDTFAVLRETRIPAVLLELGFMSNRAELNLVMTAAQQAKEVKGIADGIDKYFGK